MQIVAMECGILVSRMRAVDAVCLAGDIYVSFKVCFIKVKSCEIILCNSILSLCTCMWQLSVACFVAAMVTTEIEETMSGGLTYFLYALLLAISLACVVALLVWRQCCCRKSFAGDQPSLKDPLVRKEEAKVVCPVVNKVVCPVVNKVVCPVVNKKACK